MVPNKADADLIANAPTDIKALIEEVERLRELVARAPAGHQVQGDTENIIH